MTNSYRTPAAAHVAEKLHALTMERPTANSRTKDLVDIALLAMHAEFVARDLRNSIRATFEFRGTHEVPTLLPKPPDFWVKRYARMKTNDGLPWADLAEVCEFCSAFLHPLLGGDINDDFRWVAESSEWR